MDEITLIHGDCLEEMAKLKPNSIDTIITDPPYGIGFMGKEWDTFKPESIDKKMKVDNKRPSSRIARTQRSNAAGSYDFSRNADFQMVMYPFFKEMLRIIKPGGTLLCFGGPRTYHRVACACEDAGWILKDCIMWLYGSGFPKATDISKQMDKGHKRKTIKDKEIIEKNLFEERQIVEKERIDKKARAKGQKSALPTMGAEVEYIDIERTEPVTEQAKLWNGWKSHGLKPAYEPILVAMKPNEGSYAENALNHGVAGLNIDGGRIGHNEPEWHTKRNPRKNDTTFSNKTCGFNSEKTTLASASPQGRFPANIILDEEAAKMLDGQSGESKSSNAIRKNKQRETMMLYGHYEKCKTKGFSDKGGASRFFYVAKASKAERNAGCGGLEEKAIDIQQPHNSKSLEERYKMKSVNNHPTVKPLKLMEYLCRLTKTPTGGTVLDPFMGSGTTGMACKLTDRNFIGIEKEKGYIEIAKRRIANTQKSMF